MVETHIRNLRLAGEDEGLLLRVVAAISLCPLIMGWQLAERYYGIGIDVEDHRRGGSEMTDLNASLMFFSLAWLLLYVDDSRDAPQHRATTIVFAGLCLIAAVVNGIRCLPS